MPSPLPLQPLLDTSVTELHGVGSTLLGRLAKLRIHTIRDLLLHLPTRYQDRTRTRWISQLSIGTEALVGGKIIKQEITPRGWAMVTLLDDTTGTLALRFFHFNAGMRKKLTVGKKILAYGEVRHGPYGLEIVHPDIYLDSWRGPTTESSQHLTPTYPTTKGLHQNSIRELVAQALDLLANCADEELLPPTSLPKMVRFPQAITLLHRPPIDSPLGTPEVRTHPAYQRLLLEEMLAHQLSMLMIRSGVQRSLAHPCPVDNRLKSRFLASLPFQLTQAQVRVVGEIEDDLARQFPMLRLLQGDVGSGKTLVAALAALTVIAHKRQVVLMAPTELLAEQHVNQFRIWLEPLGIRVESLTGNMRRKERQALLDRVECGQINMLIGTHALFHQDLKFISPGLMIIDEQHRFGVHQRLMLWEKGRGSEGHCPHQLIMTATPIPRTLAMSAYADLDTSTIDQLPPGRLPINTLVLPTLRRDEVVRRLEHLCHSGGQAYWVCPLVDNSEKLEAQAALATFAELAEKLAEIRVGLVHGRMKSAEKQVIMQAFKEGDIQLLVATTVIEIGIDVPNATLMVIDGPERFGLAQIHQLRGRVGRGSEPSYCILLYKSPLATRAKNRLAVLRESMDGFLIAQRDLELRGAGELLGTRQTGETPFRVVDLVRDQELIPRVQQLARQMHQTHPEKADALVGRWLPESTRYTNA